MAIISNSEGSKQAEQLGLRKFYWENADTYLIPEEEATPEVMQKVMELLRKGKYMYFIRDDETLK